MEENSSPHPPLRLVGGYLTALRTGAVSGVATDLLARQDARVAAIFGAGVQGRTQLLGIGAVRHLERVYVIDQVPGKADEFVREMAGQPGVPSDLHAAASPAEAVRDADIICTATTSTKPVFSGGDLKKGVHINGIGAYTPQMQEIDLETLKRTDKIVIDSHTGAMAEAGVIAVLADKDATQMLEVLGALRGIAFRLRPAFL